MACALPARINNLHDIQPRPDWKWRELMGIISDTHYQEIDMRFIPVPFLFALMLPAYATLEDFDRQQILERIKPVGNVRVEGKSAATPEVSANKPVTKKLPGQEAYDNHCTTCHANGIAGAPKFRDAADWNPRLAKQNMDEMIATAIKGLNAMPPKGTCSECSEEDIKNAIQYMLPKK